MNRRGFIGGVLGGLVSMLGLGFLPRKAGTTRVTGTLKELGLPKPPVKVLSVFQASSRTFSSNEQGQGFVETESIVSLHLSRPMNMSEADEKAIRPCLPDPAPGMKRVSVQWDVALYEPVVTWTARDVEQIKAV